jgi:hypothetical protein
MGTRRVWWPLMPRVFYDERLKRDWSSRIPREFLTFVTVPGASTAPFVLIALNPRIIFSYAYRSGRTTAKLEQPRLANKCKWIYSFTQWTLFYNCSWGRTQTNLDSRCGGGYTKHTTWCIGQRGVAFRAINFAVLSLSACKNRRPLTSNGPQSLSRLFPTDWETKAGSVLRSNNLNWKCSESCGFLCTHTHIWYWDFPLPVNIRTWYSKIWKAKSREIYKEAKKI